MLKSISQSHLMSVGFSDFLSPISEHARRLDNLKCQRITFALVRVVLYRFTGGYLYPQPILHFDQNTLGCPEYSSNISARRLFSTGWSVQFDNLLRIVTLTLTRSFLLTFGFFADLRLSEATFGILVDLRVSELTFRILVNLRDLVEPSGSLANLWVSCITTLGNLRPSV